MARRLQTSADILHVMTRFLCLLIFPFFFLPLGLGAAETTLTLEDAIRFALEKNPQIRVDDYSRSIARANLLAERGRFDPAITFERSYREDSSLAASNVIIADLIKTDIYSIGLEGTTPWGMSYRIGGQAQNQRYPQTGYTDNFASTGIVGITQPLLRDFGFSTNLLGVRIAKADRAIADWEFRASAMDTVTNAVIAYSDLAYAQQLVRIANRSRDLAAGFADENEKRFKVGQFSESDITQARSRAASREEFILVAQQALRDAVNRLRQVMGEDNFPVAPENFAIEPLELPEAPSVNAAEDLKLAYENRPDYQAARLGLTKTRYAESSARNQLLPRVDFVGTYGYNGLDPDFGRSRSAVWNSDNRSYSAGVVVRVPLTFAEGRGRFRSAKLQRRQAEANLDLLEQEIAVEVARAAGQLETTHRRVEANRVALDLARQVLDDELKKLRAGTTSTFLVLSYQTELISAEQAYYAAQADERRARANYDRVLGRTLEVRHITLASAK